MLLRKIVETLSQVNLDPSIKDFKVTDVANNIDSPRTLDDEATGYYYEKGSVNDVE